MQRLEVSGAVRHIYIYVIRRLKVKVKNVACQLCTESQSKYFMFNDSFLFFINRAVVEIIWKYAVQPDRLQMTM
jgi:hypothetical protein